MRYRVEELAARARISVDTVRFYQTRGLLSLPEREGRVVFYSDEHLAAPRAHPRPEGQGLHAQVDQGPARR